MPGRVRIKIKGDKELQRTLRKINADVRNKAQEAAVLSAALIVVNDAKRKAPVLTGTLRRSIHIGGNTGKTPDFQPTPEAPELPRPERRGNAVVVFVGTNVPYAARIEFGFAGQDSLGRTYSQAAKPYLRPALDNNLNKVIQEMAEVLWSFMEKAA